MNRFPALRPSRAKLSALIAAASSAALPVMAQTVDPFTTTMTTITGKVETYGVALVTLAGVAIAFYLAIKFVKKIPKAA